MCLIREDLSKLNYVTLCIKESLRLYTTVPFIGKLSSEDVVVNGYRIPKGTKLLDNMYIRMYILRLSDSENNTITIVKVLVFMIVNTINS